MTLFWVQKSTKTFLNVDIALLFLINYVFCMIILFQEKAITINHWKPNIATIFILMIGVKTSGFSCIITTNGWKFIKVVFWNHCKIFSILLETPITLASRTAQITGDSLNLLECVRWRRKCTSVPETRYSAHLWCPAQLRHKYWSLWTLSVVSEY